MLTKLNAQEITTIGFYPTKPLLEGKISFKLLLQHMKGIYFYMSNDICINHIYAFVALGISLICMGDPREFFISCVNDHIPELQMEFGFAVSSKGKILIYYHTTATVLFFSLPKIFLVNLMFLCSAEI